MNIEQQVVSLELAKRLKELGVKQESLFVWEFYDDKCYGVKFIPYPILPAEFYAAKLYSAFTVAELGEMLPFKFEIENNSSPFYLEIRKYGELFFIQYCDSDDPWYKPIEVSNSTEANARAEMLIWLIENGLIKNESI